MIRPVALYNWPGLDSKQNSNVNHETVDKLLQTLYMSSDVGSDLLHRRRHDE